MRRTHPCWARAGLCALTVVAFGGLGACAAPAAEPEQLRVLVKLVRPSSDGAAIAREAAAAAGVPVRYLAATSAQWHALALRCGPALECDGALQRLRADTATFAAVERDERRRPAAR